MVPLTEPALSMRKQSRTALPYAFATSRWSGGRSAEARLRLALYRPLVALAFAAGLLFPASWLGAQPTDKVAEAGKAGSTLPEVSAPIAAALQDREYAKAVTLIDAALQAAPQEATASPDYLRYLRGRALHLQAKYDAALETYAELLKQHPQSPWARKARFAQGISHARKGSFREAELAYRAEADFFLSQTRLDQVAEVYREFADAYFEPPEDKTPDYQQAVDFYRKALEVGPNREHRGQLRFRIGRCLQELKDHPGAIAQYRSLIDESPAAKLLIETRYRLGEVLLAKGDLVEARAQWRDLLTRHADSDAARLAEAAFRISETYRLPKPGDDGELDLGIAALRKFLKAYGTHELAGKAHLRIAESYFHRQRWSDAEASLREFLADKQLAQSPEIPDARRLLGSACQLQAKYDQALETWRQYLTLHPTHSQWSQVQREMIETEYSKAAEAYRQEKYAEARKLWEAFLAKYPLDGRSPQILLEFGRIHYRQEAWEAAIAEWRKLVSKYPQGEVASQAQYLIGQTLEEKLGDLETALKEYRKLSWGKFQARAQSRLRRLTTESLRIGTPRKFRSDEVPFVDVKTRNLETVSAKVYAIDLETYFRKMHEIGGIEALDIALIDPDSTREIPVKGFEKHRELKNSIDVALPGDAKAGAAVATVSSETREATTLVLQSDLDIIVKGSRDEVFVFAENMRTGKPWSGVRVLVSDGTKLVAEGETGEEGVYRTAREGLADVEQLRVFAAAGAHVASNIEDLAGLSAGQGLTPTGYVYTDRYAYRPGQLVHFRGIIRHVADDQYQIVPEKKYTLAVSDSRQRLLHEQEVQLNDFGAFSAHLALPDSVAPGTCRLMVRGEDDEVYSAEFVVQQFRLQPVRLEVDAERAIYYRGEVIEGKLRASYYYGSPVAGRLIRYRLLPGNQVLEGKTDAEGALAFRFETERFTESQSLILAAELPEFGIQTQQPLVLATQGFQVRLETSRDVYVAEEPFELRVFAESTEGKPVSRELTVRVFRQVEVGRQLGEQLVKTLTVTTDEQGQARIALSLSEGGSYVVRCEGVDRFENPVSTRKELQVSDEQDAVRLRVLADQLTYQAGDTAKLRVHWREQPALALVTYEGTRILRHQLVTLKQGMNPLDLKLDADLAPNFHLSVAVMTDRREPLVAGGPLVRFHQATAPLEVERQLNVTLEITAPGKPDAKIQPGDEITVTVKTTDPQGKPVAGEVSLALVEQALIDRYPDPLDSIEQFFRGTPRAVLMNTASSANFRYGPPTKAIDQQLLEERERELVESSERSSLGALFGDADADANVDGIVARDPFATPGESGDPFGAPSPPAIAGFGMGGGMGGGGMGGGGMGANFGSGGMAGGGLAANGNGTPQPQSGLLEMGAAQQQANNPFGGDGQRQLLGDQLQSQRDFAYFSSNLSLQIAQTQTVNAPFADNTWYDLRSTPGKGLQLLDGKGRFLHFNPAGSSEEEIRARLREFVGQGGRLVGGIPQETGYWNPSVRTDANGIAELKLTLPARSTAWQFDARGITLKTLAGRATRKVQVSKPLFAQLKVPTAATVGDEVDFEVSIHNLSLPESKVEVELSTKIGARTTVDRKTVAVKMGTVLPVTFRHRFDLPAEAVHEREMTVTARIVAGELSDATSTPVAVRPDGAAVYDLAGGTATGDALAVVEHPPQWNVQAPHLQVLIGPTIEQSLLDAVLGGPQVVCQLAGAELASGGERASSDLLASLGLQKLLGKTRDAGGPQAEALDARIRESVALLVSLQNDDGGWSWAEASKQSDRYMSSRVVWALSEAKAAGYRVAATPLESATRYLQNQVSQARPDDYETKAVLLQALVASGKEDFPLANQLYRNRPALSSPALAYLALAMAQMQRLQAAGELVALLEGAPAERRQQAKNLGWNRSDADFHAVSALALAAAGGKPAQLAAQVDWLMAHRTGARWTPDRATGPAMLAVCQWLAAEKFEAERFTLQIYVNDFLAKELTIDQQSRSQLVDIPDNLLKQGKQSVRFVQRGRGRYTYQCVYSAFAQADKLATNAAWEVSRTLQPAARQRDGVPVPRGFDVVAGTYTSFQNPLQQLPVAHKAEVDLKVRRRDTPRDTPAENLPYLVVTEPLPAGATVLEDSIKGGFAHYELRPGEIVFYLGHEYYLADIHYEFYGYLPGTCRVGPTLARDAFQPDQLAVSEGKSLVVLPSGQASADKYRLTPRELYEFGQWHHQKQEFPAAEKYLTELFESWKLKDDVYKNTVRMLLDTSLATNSYAKVVKYFEIIVEKYPDLKVGYNQYLQIGRAYHEIGEYERSYLVFRAVVERSFLRESAVVGTLLAKGEFLRGTGLMDRLLRDYPAEPYLASATYAFAQQVYAKAPQAANDAKLRAAKVNRVTLIEQAIRRLSGFLAEFPDDPAADQASFAVTNALLDLEQYPSAIQHSQQFARRYPESKLLDSFWYAIGFSHYALGQHEAALAMCRKVAESQVVDRRSGRVADSPNKWRAIYILGQIHHSLGEAAKAIEQYTRVQDRFEDAQQAIAYFQRRAVELPDLTRLLPNEKAVVELKFRNIAACDVTVYRIDLLKFSLLRRNFSEITEINLAGIRPLHEATIELGTGKDYRDRTRELPLPLKEEGAYLVVCRGAGLHASGLVLITPLELEVQEERESGQVRTTVRDAVKERYLDKALVKVIGSRNKKFVTGETDLRGVFVAQSITGESLVIARAGDDQYAFHRGTLPLGPAAPPTEEPQAPAKGNAKGAPQATGKDVLLEGLQEDNRSIQIEQQKSLNDAFEQGQGGFGGGGFGGGGVF